MFISFLVLQPCSQRCKASYLLNIRCTVSIKIHLGTSFVAMNWTFPPFLAFDSICVFTMSVTIAEIWYKNIVWNSLKLPCWSNRLASALQECFLYYFIFATELFFASAMAYFWLMLYLHLPFAKIAILFIILHFNGRSSIYYPKKSQPKSDSFFSFTPSVCVRKRLFFCWRCTIYWLYGTRVYTQI